MRKTKKLALLLLSLVLLIGTFTVLAIAEEASQTATVVYPDGTTETVEVGAKIEPKSLKTVGEVVLYEGANNTLFKMTGTDWTFTVVGESEALSDLTITKEMAGKTILAGGAEQVYFTVYRSDLKVTEYKTTNTVSSHINATNFPSNGGYTATITLYADSNSSSFGLRTNTSGNTVKLDLNGHTITVKNRIEVTYGSYYIYSSKPGAHFYSGAGDSGMIWTNNGGTVYLGDISTGEYADNIFFHAKVVFKYLYGGGISILGGHYYQTEPSQGFVDIARRVSKIQNASFYLAAGSQSLLISDKEFTGDGSDSYGAATGTNPITNCKFYSPDSETPILYNTFSAAPKFTNCEFNGVAATVIGGSGSVTADDTCTFGNAITYKTVTWENGAKENYYPISEEVADNYIVAHPNTKATFEIKSGDKLFYVFTPIASISYDENLNATVIKTGLPVEIAFTYSVNGGATQYIPTFGSAEADGARFIAELNEKSNLKIVMYHDIVLTSGVVFGTYKANPDSTTKPILDKTGSIDWDLNGCTVTVAKDAKSIPMVMHQDGGDPQVNVLHFIGAYTFKLYSSIPNGKYVNNSSYSIFGVHKTSSHRASYILGTNDPAKNGGNNLTIESAGMILEGYENGGTPIQINGGTYIYSGSGNAFYCGGTSKINNATIITTGKSASVFKNNWWVSANFTIDDSIVVAKNSATKLIIASNTALNGTHKINLGDVVLIGGGLKPVYNLSDANKLVYTISGNILASDLVVLSTAYPSAPENTTQAYTSVNANGETYKVLGYFGNDEIVTVQNAKLETTELWRVGSKFIFDSTITDQDQIIKLDDAYYYLNNAAWVSRVNGAVCEDVCASANAGETVILAIEGENSPLYFTVYSEGATAFYHDDAAAAKAALESRLKNIGENNFTLTLYSDMTSTNGTMFTLNNSKSPTCYFDLNGFTWTFDIPADTQNVITTQNGSFYFYSSVEGARFVATSTKSIILTDSGSRTYFGEKDSNSTEYGKNITFEGKKINHQAFYGNSLHIYGGTYILRPDSSTDFAINNEYAAIQMVRDATFILKNIEAIFKGTNIGGTIKNCSFISETPTNLYVFKQDKMSSKTFEECNFYNVTPTVTEGFVMTYKDCNFNKAYNEAQAGGYIAYTGELVTKTVNGVDYVFGAKLVEKAALVDWGFGLGSEYWAIGATATHENALINGVFTYAFKPFVVSENNEIVYALIGVEKGAIQMSLTLQSQIGLNLIINSGMLSPTDVKVGDQVLAQSVDEANGKIKVSFAVSPTKADENVIFTIVVNGYEHNIPVSVGAYAKAVLGNKQLSEAHDLTYAMVEYVRSMTSPNFLEEVEIPNYGNVGAPSNGEAGGNSGCDIAFCLDGVIKIAVKGATGTTVELKLPRRNLSASVENGVALFDSLAVNELAAEFTVVVDGKAHTYSLADYYYAIANSTDEATKAKASIVAALYNYAYHAREYAKRFN